ncbi:MAG: hypothetical protein ACRDQ0_16760 [Pseudonocardia sp.]
MTASRVASIAALVGGLGWLIKVGLIWANGGTNTDGGPVGVMFFVGMAGLVVALAASGYALVATAPIWLRGVVTVALPVLVFMIWQLVDGVIKALYTKENWLQGELNILLAAVIALGLGLWGLRRPSPGGAPPPPRHTRGNHVAR